MVTRRRILAVLVLLVCAAGAYTGWLLWQVQGDLHDAENAADRLQTAVKGHDDAARDDALADLTAASESAAGHTDGPWWGAMTHVPWVGDDARGVRALSQSLDLISHDGIEPLVASVDDLDHLSADGRVDLDVIAGLQDPVAKAARAFHDAHAMLSPLDTAGYAGRLRTQFDRYVDRIADADEALASADTATAVLPDMVGAEGARDYLLIFQNNAEIRATGGMPGSWAQIHAVDGKVTIVKQGTAGDFPVLPKPALPLSDGERKVYFQQLGTYFQDAGFTPDFPRAADLLAAHWAKAYPTVHLDGILALDPVAMSYLLEGTGPVTAGGITLTPDNVVEELLSKPYLTLEPAAQDALFQEVARAIFDAATGNLASPVDFVRGLNRAADEGRFLVAPFVQSDAEAIGDSRVIGALAGDDGKTPHVDIGVNDATGSKMSYYLRYWADVEAKSCQDGRQTLAGSMTLNQQISPEKAAELPESVTGTGEYGTERGSQLVAVRLYAPWGGSIDKVSLDGKSQDRDIEIVDVNGRPVTTLAVLLSSRDDVVINWTMTTGEGQSGTGRLGMTPSIVPGSNDASFASAC